MSEPAPVIGWHALLDVFGPRFLEFVLNASVVSEPVDPVRSPIVEQLRQVASVATSLTDAFERRRIMDSLCMPVRGTEDSSSFARNSRRHCGGATPSADDGEDLVVEALLEMAIDTFVASMLPTIDLGMRGVSDLGGVPWSLAAHPGQSRFVATFLADPELAQLFPTADDVSTQPAVNDPDQISQAMSEVIWSTGNGGTLSAATLSYGLLGYLLTVMRLENDETLEHLLPHMRSAVTTVRRLATKRSAKVFAVAALSNLSLEDGCDVGLPRGRIVDVAGLRRLLPFVSQSATAVLYTRVDLKLLDLVPRNGAPDLEESNRRWAHRAPAFEASNRALQREFDRARLAAVLASADAVLAPVVGASTVLNPLSGGSGSWASFPFSFAPLPPVDVGREQAVSISEWAYEVDTHPESLWLGARRLLSAVTGRLDPLDGFVDAVVCWENMLGTGEGETTFRVCAGLAFVIEPIDVNARADLFKELTALYRNRSRLVHGAHEPKVREATDLRDRSLAIAIRGMRAIYDRPELRNAQSSSERSRIVLLGI